MGLDKWLQSDKEEKNNHNEPNAASSEKKEQKSKKNNVQESKLRLFKFTLICTNSKCKYQKVLMKRALGGKDKTCPRCKSEMKVKG